VIAFLVWESEKREEKLYNGRDFSRPNVRASHSGALSGP
jgi:hypothetical protein